jgi:hypothetical protein
MKVEQHQPITYPGALEVLFIGLKLSHIIFWSWWWVLSPTWIVAILGALAYSRKEK